MSMPPYLLKSASLSAALNGRLEQELALTQSKMKQRELLLASLREASAITQSTKSDFTPHYKNTKDKKVLKSTQSLNSGNATSSNARPSLFSQSTLDDLHWVSSILETVIKRFGGEENVTVIGIGASSLWFLEVLKTRGYKGKIQAIPLSNGSYLKNASSPNVQAYKQFLISLGLNSQFFDASNGSKRVLVIDCVKTGTTLANFKNILMNIDPRFDEAVHLLGIREVTWQSLPYSFQTVSIQSNTLNETQHDRLIRSFTADEWLNWEKLDFSPLISTAIEAKKAQLANADKKLDHTPFQFGI